MNQDFKSFILLALSCLFLGSAIVLTYNANQTLNESKRMLSETQAAQRMLMNWKNTCANGQCKRN